MNGHTPDRDAAALLAALAAPYAGLDAPDLHGELRPLRIGRKGAVGPAHWYPFTPAAVASAARRAVALAPEYDVTVSVLPRVPIDGELRGRRANVPCAAWLWADVDPGDGDRAAAAELVKRAGVPPPHIAVASGAGLHVYWRLAQPELLPDDAERQRYEAALRRVALAIGGKAPGAHADLAACHVQFTLRVPGTVNHKRQRPVRLLRLIRPGEAPSLRWWRANLPPEPAPPRRWAPRGVVPPPPGETRPLPEYAQAILSAPTPPGERHAAAKRLVCAAVSRGFDSAALAAICELFCNLNNWSWPEMSSLARWAQERITCQTS